jgi:hypothetical protein
VIKVKCSIGEEDFMEFLVMEVISKVSSLISMKSLSSKEKTQKKMSQVALVLNKFMLPIIIQQQF